PIKTMRNLFDKGGADVKFDLVTADRDLGDTKPAITVDIGVWNEIGSAHVVYVNEGVKGYFLILKIVFLRGFDLIYLNSFFSPRFSFFPLLLARALGQKVVLGPRGEFSEGALSLKTTKKRLFIKMFKLLGLHRGTVFQASSDYEAEDIRRALGPAVDILVAENIGAQEFAERPNLRTDRALKAVFISRISPKKNLLAALEMLHKVQ